MKKILPVIAIMMLLTSCGGEYVARVGNIKIKPEEFRFYLNSIKSQMQGTELKTDYDWENQEIEGKKAIDVAKERAIDNAIKNALYIEASKAAGVKLTSEELTLRNRIKTQIVEKQGGRESYNQYLKDNNITDKFINSMVESSAYIDKLGKKLSVEKPETEEELLEYYEQNKSELETRFRKAKHILFLTTDEETGFPLSKAERERARRNAQQVLKRVRAGEDFDALMHEFSEDPGLSTNPDGYVFGTGEMVPEFESCVDSMGFDQFEMCESEYGYHVVKRIPVSYEDIEDRIKKEVLNSKIEETIAAWAEEYGIEVERFEENYKDIK